MNRGITRGVGNSFNLPPKALPEQAGTGDMQKDLASIAHDMRLLVDQFVLPPLFQKTVINLTSGQSLVINSLTQKVGSIIVSITAGKLDVWIGEQGTPTAGTVADWEFTVTGSPVQLVLPPDTRIFTCLANGATTQGVFILSSV